MTLRLPVRLPVPDRTCASQAGKMVLHAVCDVLNAPTGADTTVLVVLAVIMLASGMAFVTLRRRVVTIR